MAAPHRSSSIPDPNLITLYAERGASVLHRLDPRAKAGALAWLVLFVTLVQATWVLVLAWVATVVVYRLGGLPLRELLRWYLIPTLFVLSLVVFLVWEEPGAPVLEAGGVVLTTGGVELVVSLLARALATVTFTLVVLMTTRYVHLAGLAAQVLPSPIDQVFLLSYRFLFTTLGLIDGLLLALRARGSGLARGVLTRTRLFAGVFALSFVRAYDRADRVGRAMAARGYDGRFPPAEPLPPRSASQLGAVAVAFAVLALAALGGLPVFGRAGP
jgi:cobalt/nickel transport system permease protein